MDTTQFARVSRMEEDGLYLHKRHIRGDHGKMLEQAGTALLHTVVYLKAGKKVRESRTPVGELARNMQPLQVLMLHKGRSYREL